jgi:hypothetical protein
VEASVLGGIGLALLGIGLVVLGRRMSARDRGFRRRAVVVPGVVVGHEMRAKRAHPVVRYDRLDGTEATVVGSEGRTPAQHDVGAEIGVAVDPQSPEVVQVEPKRQRAVVYVLRVTGWCFLLAGIGFVVAGFLTG